MVSTPPPLRMTILLVSQLPSSGKTEIARRLAKMSDAPFIKVEATKFTEVGYHGRDVDSIIKDLVGGGSRPRQRSAFAVIHSPLAQRVPQVENAILLVRQKLRDRSAAMIRQQVEAMLLKLVVVQHPNLVTRARTADKAPAMPDAEASTVADEGSTGSGSGYAQSSQAAIEELKVRC